MNEDILLEIGLTKSEAALYMALLEIGSTTTGPLLKQACIASGKAYVFLDRLVEKGLVTHSTQSGTRYYQAKDPERLLVYFEEKQEQVRITGEKLKKLVSRLKEKYQKEKYQTKTETYEGIKGFKTFHNFMLSELKKGDSVCVMGAPKEANEKYEAFFIEWNKKRVKKGVSLKILYNHDSKEFGKKREKLPLTEVRYMKKELETPAWVDLFHDYVVTLNVHTTPVCFVIKNKETAQSYKEYFNVLWKQAKK